MLKMFLYNQYSKYKTNCSKLVAVFISPLVMVTFSDFLDTKKLGLFCIAGIILQKFKSKIFLRF